MTDFICYMNEYGLVTANEATAKLWAEAGTDVYVMRPDFMYGDVDLTYPRRPLSEVLTVHKEDTTQFPYAPSVGTMDAWDRAYIGWQERPPVNHADDANCAPDPKGVSFHFDAVKVSGDK